MIKKEVIASRVALVALMHTIDAEEVMIHRSEF